MNLEKQKEIVEEKLKSINESINKKSIKFNNSKSKFYHFNQNNSGGGFEENENVCKDVFIEAHSSEEANILADNIGIYFDGCDMGIDCSCCGDRWYPVEEVHGMEEPKVYGILLKDCFKDMFDDMAIVHYLDGRKQKIIFKTVLDCKKHIWKQQYDIGEKCEICHVWKKHLKEEIQKLRQRGEGMK